MRVTTLIFAVAAFVFAGLALTLFGVDASTQAAASSDVYEIKDADRGPVQRVKVLLNGRTISTLVMSKGRTGSSAYCCSAAGCQEIPLAASCSTFRMICDKYGNCRRG